MEVKIKPVKINGVDYITVREMSTIVNKSDQTIYNLITHGNSIRTMKCLKLGQSVLIPYTEVVEFPFTWPGNNASDNVYHYTYDGKIINEKDNVDE